MNKKGVFFEGLMLIVVVVSLITAYVVLDAKQGKFERAIGEQQYELINTYQEGEKALYYLDESAKQATILAISELAQKSGMKDVQCGTYYGYPYWQLPDENGESKDCTPKKEAVDKDFLTLYRTHFNRFLLDHNFYDFPVEYTLKVEEKLDVEGITTQELILQIGKRPASQNTFTQGNTQQAVQGKFRWPLSSNSPTNFIITSCYGSRNCAECITSNHRGVDIGAPRGEIVLAAADGKVVALGTAGYNSIVINHSFGFVTRYLHNSERLVQVGQQVRAGTQIGKVGGSGPSGPTQFPPHLHFEIRDRPTGNALYGKAFDPLLFFDRKGLGLKYKRTGDPSNCWYNRRNYAYNDEIGDNVV